MSSTFLLIKTIILMKDRLGIIVKCLHGNILVSHLGVYSPAFIVEYVYNVNNNRFQVTN
jgi:hypothetical protein